MFWFYIKKCFTVCNLSVFGFICVLLFCSIYLYVYIYRFVFFKYRTYSSLANKIYKTLFLIIICFVNNKMCCTTLRVSVHYISALLSLTTNRYYSGNCINHLSISVSRLLNSSNMSTILSNYVV